MRTYLLYIFLLLYPLSMAAQKCVLTDDTHAAILDNVGMVLLMDDDCPEKDLFLFYPNPTVGFLFSSVRGSVFNTRGQQVGTIEKGENDLSELPQGIYIFRNATKICKFVKV